MSKALKSEESLEKKIIKLFDLKPEGNGKKPFYKSVRFGYDIFEAIDGVLDKSKPDKNGKYSFNEVFNDICIDYTRTIPERKLKVQELDEQISDKRKQLKKLTAQLEKINKLVTSTEALLNSVKQLQEATNKLSDNL